MHASSCKHVAHQGTVKPNNTSKAHAAHKHFLPEHFDHTKAFHDNTPCHDWTSHDSKPQAAKVLSKESSNAKLIFKYIYILHELLPKIYATKHPHVMITLLWPAPPFLLSCVSCYPVHVAFWAASLHLSPVDAISCKQSRWAGYNIKDNVHGIQV